MQFSRKIVFSLITLVAAIAVHADETPTVAPDARPVVYQWTRANFHPAGDYPYSGTTVPSPGGDRLCINAKSAGFNNFIVGGAGKLKAGRDYAATLKYEIVTPTEYPNSFYMFARSRKLGTSRDVWRSWLGKPGVPATVTLVASVADADDWTITVGCKGPGAIIVDDFKIVEGSGYAFLPARSAKSLVKSAGLVASKLPTGAAENVILPPAPKKPLTISAGDFGLVADSATGPASAEVAAANFDAMKKAVDAARSQGASVLAIPKGVYRFSSKVPIAFENLTDMTIDGQGSEFVFEKLHPGLATISVLGCERAIVKNLFLDWDWDVTPIASLCKVVAVAPDNLSCDLTFPDLTASQVEAVKSAPWMQMLPMDPVSFRLPYVERLATSVAKFETVGPTTLRVTFKSPVAVQPDKIYCVRHLYYEMSAFRIGDSTNLLFDNIAIYSMPGMGFVNRGDLSHWGFHNCRIARRPGSRHPFTTAADGFHVLESRGYLTLDGCEFTGCGDDCINIHDNCYEGLRRDDDHTLTLLGNQKYRFKVSPGDELEICNSDYSPLPFTAKALTVTYKGNDTVLTFAETLPSAITASSIVYSHRYDTSNVRIANCNFHDTSGRGILLSARGATIENCVFDRTFADAIQTTIDIVGTLWAEGRPSSNFVVRNNVLKNVNAQGKFGGAAIYMAPILPDGGSQYPLYSNMLIANNRFVNCNGPAVQMSSCKGIAITGNTIETTGELTSATAQSSSLMAVLSSDLALGGNTWRTVGTLAKAGVVYDPVTVSGIAASDNVVMPGG